MHSHRNRGDFVDQVSIRKRLSEPSPCWNEPSPCASSKTWVGSCSTDKRCKRTASGKKIQLPRGSEKPDMAEF